MGKVDLQHHQQAIRNKHAIRPSLEIILLAVSGEFPYLDGIVNFRIWTRQTLSQTESQAAGLLVANEPF